VDDAEHGQFQLFCRFGAKHWQSGTGEKNVGAHIAVNDEYRHIAVHPAYLFKTQNPETIFEMAGLAQAAAAFQARSEKGAAAVAFLDALLGWTAELLMERDHASKQGES